MKTNRLLSLLLILVMLVGMLSFTACGKTAPTDDASADSTQDNVENDDGNNNGEDVSNDTVGNVTEQQKTHSEYVKTYYIYAEQGAVVTWFDAQTGQFKYQAKCETCDKEAGGEHGGGLYLTSSVSSHNAGFTCTNPQCSMWGKPQRAIIKCEERGEWVEVTE